jgi:hypothetical protein
MQFFYFSFLEIFNTKQVKQLLLEENERLMKQFIPKLVIFRAMLHLNQVIEAKKDALLNKKENLKDLFKQVQDKKIDFGKLSAKENRYEVIKGMKNNPKKSKI